MMFSFSNTFYITQSDMHKFPSGAAEVVLAFLPLSRESLTLTSFVNFQILSTIIYNSPPSTVVDKTQVHCFCLLLLLPYSQPKLSRTFSACAVAAVKEYTHACILCTPVYRVCMHAYIHKWMDACTVRKHTYTEK
jgi:hypothetical protein